MRRAKREGTENEMKSNLIEIFSFKRPEAHQRVYSCYYYRKKVREGRGRERDREVVCIMAVIRYLLFSCVTSIADVNFKQKQPSRKCAIKIADAYRLSLLHYFIIQHLGDLCQIAVVIFTTPQHCQIHSFAIHTQWHTNAKMRILISTDWRVKISKCVMINEKSILMSAGCMDYYFIIPMVANGTEWFRFTASFSVIMKSTMHGYSRSHCHTISNT